MRWRAVFIGSIVSAFMAAFTTAMLAGGTKMTTRIVEMKREADRKDAEFKESMRRHELHSAYMMGSIWTLLCDTPKMKPHTHDTKPCQEHYEKTGQNKRK